MLGFIFCLLNNSTHVPRQMTPVRIVTPHLEIPCCFVVLLRRIQRRQLVNLDRCHLSDLLLNALPYGIDQICVQNVRPLPVWLFLYIGTLLLGQKQIKRIVEGALLDQSSFAEFSQFLEPLCF